MLFLIFNKTFNNNIYNIEKYINSNSLDVDVDFIIIIVEIDKYNNDTSIIKLIKMNVMICIK